MANKTRGEVIISGITSNTMRMHEGDTEITEWEKAGLKVPSLATAILQTVKKERIRKRFGQLAQKNFERIEGDISAIIGFSVHGKRE